MPYIIIHRERHPLPGSSAPSGRLISPNHAVASIKDVAEYLAPIVGDGDITIPGRTYLTDGNVIDVRDIDWNDLQALACYPDMGASFVTKQSVIDAYNFHRKGTL
jgi:hypothetical protein